MSTDSNGNPHPSCLATLTADQKRAVNDQLSNNEVADDDELAEHLEKVVGLTAEQARAVVGYRGQAFADFTFELFPGFHH